MIYIYHNSVSKKQKNPLTKLTISILVHLPNERSVVFFRSSRNIKEYTTLDIDIKSEQ